MMLLRRDALRRIPHQYCTAPHVERSQEVEVGAFWQLLLPAAAPAQESRTALKWLSRHMPHVPRAALHSLFRRRQVNNSRSETSRLTRPGNTSS
jgi:hypothetical protein